MTSETITEPQSVKCHFVQDSLNRRKYQLRAEWEPKAKYELMIPAGALFNVAQEQNDTIRCKYEGSDPETYAIVNVKVLSTKRNARYILQITNAQGKLQKQIVGATSGTYRFDYVNAGDIMIRVVEDLNGNGKWDTGDMVLMRQPERTEIYKNDDGIETITTKANWEFDIDVDMDKLFAPITMESVIKMLNDREDERLKKLAEEQAKKRQQQQQNQGGQSGQSSGGFGFGGLGGMGGGGTTSGGLRSGTSTTGSMGMGTNTMRR
jgi:uncharacterized membrane protein YgcG